MKKFIICLVLILSPSFLWAAPAYVQGRYGESTGTQITVSYPSSVTAGSLLVVINRDGGVDQTPTCTSGGRTFSVAATESYDWRLAVSYLPNAAGGSTSVTCTYASSTDQIRTTVLEFSGVATSSPLVDTATNMATGIPSAGPVTTTAANSLLVFAAASDSDSYHTVPQPSSGWTLINLWTGSNDDPDKTAEEWRVAATAGDYNGSFATVSANPYAAVLVAFAPSGSGSDTTAPQLSGNPTIQSSGTSLSITFDETVSIGSGGNGGWSISPSGGAATLTYVSGSGSSTLVYTISREIQYNETATVSYTQPGNGIEDSAGNDLANISAHAVTNSSGAGAPSTYHWVSTSGAAAWGSCVGVTDPGVYCSLATANSNLSASSGQNIVYLVAGTYNSNGERISPTNDGTASYPLNYIGVGTVTISGSACDGGASEAAVQLTGDDYIIVDNIKATGCDTFLYVNNSDHNEIKNCSFDDSFDDSWPASFVGNGSTYNWIHDSQFSKGGTAASGGNDIGSVIDIGTDGGDLGTGADDDGTYYNLLEDCTIFHGGHQVIGLFSSYNTIRNNYFHNEAWVSGYGNRIVSNISPQTTVGKNTIEGNRFGYTGPSVDDGGVGNVVILSPANIIRYNSIYHSYAYGLALAGYTGYSNAANNRIYNNTIFNSGLGGGSTDYGVYVTTDAGRTPTGNVFKNNLYYQNPDGYRGGQAYASQTWVNEFTSGNPLFVNASTTPPTDKTDSSVPDLNLSSGSPAINYGGALTTASSGCNSSTLVLADATYFQDGSYGPPGKVDADWLAVGTVSNAQQISSISGNTVTMAGSVSCTNGASVWLYKDSDGTQVLYGTAPDAGAYEYDSGTTPAAPTKVRIIMID